MRKPLFFVAFAVAVGASPSPAGAEYLYDGFVAPKFTADTFYWGSFVDAKGGANNATAEWHDVGGHSTPYITATGDPLARVTEVTGAIYGFASPLHFSVQGSASFPVETVLFQFGTTGALIDFSSIQLIYDDGTGPKSLAPTDYLKEFQEFTSDRGISAGNRNALQWDLRGLNIQSYTIVWQGETPHVSFLPEVWLDAGDEYVASLPGSGTFNATGALQSWSQGTNWEGGSAPGERANVTVSSPDDVGIDLDQDVLVSELIIDTDRDVTIVSNSDHQLTFGTGIDKRSTATGELVIEADASLDAYSLFNIEAGTVTFESALSGDYGFFKKGDGILHFKGNNTFGATGGSIAVEGGVVRFDGTNEYTGATTIGYGTLIVTNDALSGVVGSLGNSTTALVVGVNEADYTHFPGYPDELSAQFVTEGNLHIGRDVVFGNGTLHKTIKATESSEGTLFSGAVSFSPLAGQAADNIFFETGAADDRLTFSGAITGGTTGYTLTTKGPGTIIFSGSTKNYLNNTVVQEGTLDIQSNFIGSGDVTVADGARLVVSGTLAGSGDLALESGAILSGTGLVNRVFTVGDGVTIAPGNSPGTLHTADQTWEGGGTYLWTINDVIGGEGAGWSSLEIDGTLAITADENTPFRLVLNSLNLANEPGLAENFDIYGEYEWQILSADSIVGFDVNAFELDLGLFATLPDLGVFSLWEESNALFLRYEGVPEPGTWALLVGGGIAAYLRQRRRKKVA